MAESISHLRLVEIITSFVEEEYVDRYHLVLFHDLPGPIGAEKPPRVGGYLPDVYASSAPPTVTVIGEAKTQNDLVTEHSRNQFTAFLSFLHRQSSGILVVGVPWPSRATAKNLLRTLKEEVGCDVVIYVIDETANASAC